MTILVTGATGLVGRNVVRQLIEAGQPVRALSRDPQAAAKLLPAGAELVRGDLTDPEGLRPALAGVDRLYLFPVDEAATRVVELAVEAGVRRIVDLSAAAVTVGLHHNPVETVVESSGLEWTHVRPAGFMGNMLPLWAPMVRAGRVVRYPYGDTPGDAPIHEADIAAVAVAALLGEGHHGRAYTLTGPRRMTVREQVAAIAEGIGEPVGYEEVSREQARAELKTFGGLAAQTADLMLGFAEYGGAPSEGDANQEQDWSALMRVWPTVEEVLGRPGLTFADWARDHAADFR
ncbi:SDR family oxidoreductase [Longispora albida]|uniref:SDR family oxidoreductase n=1 Tax=Longispora albida TaxID=203523 RepID=UPI0003823E4A|nr:NAD(P)H-binding protein [Longispora albida]